MTGQPAQPSIRPADRTDMPALVAAFGQEMFLADRIGRARHNVGELLVAWRGDVPVGNVYVWLEPPEEPELRERFPDRPILNHLEVLPKWRRRGIGTALVRAAEEAIRQRGHDVAMLLVGTNNNDARRLYERLGYVDWGGGTIIARWTEPDGHGGVHEASLACNVMTKSLQAPGPDAWDAWRPRDLAAQLSDVGVSWYVAGGWALELWRQTRGAGRLREHDDLEFATSRSNFNAVAAAFAKFDLFSIDTGTIRPLAAGTEPPPHVHQVRVCESEIPAYRADIFLEPGDDANWVYRRDERIARPYEQAVGRTREGVSFLRPEGVLLYKAQAPREKDRADFAAVIGDLDGTARGWLTDALRLAYPGHEWLSVLT